MMYERIVQSAGLRGRGGGQGAGGRGRVAKEHEAAEVTQVCVFFSFSKKSLVFHFSPFNVNNKVYVVSETEASTRPEGGWREKRTCVCDLSFLLCDY